MEYFEFSGSDLLLWRQRQLNNCEKESELDWLLDIGGGLRVGALKMLQIDPIQSVRLHRSLEDLESLWRKYLDENIPLQYLVGRCFWRDLELEISSAALIPRQETELLVDLACQKMDGQNVVFWADLGTGSGALAIALARFFKGAKGHAVDCSIEALSLANHNFRRLAPRGNCQFHLGSWWEPLRPWWGFLDLVLVNPPYVPSELIADLDPLVRDHEPHLALCGGIDGLEACRKVIAGSFAALAPRGFLLIEHHYDQSDAVLSLMRSVGFEDVAYELDLQGIRRFAIARHP